MSKAARPREEKDSAAKKPAGRGLADQLARLGLARDADLVLHLPLRYEDHTRLTPLASLQPGLAVQAEGVVVNTDIQYRPRRQLVCLIADPGKRDAQLVLRFFTFYPSQQKALQPGHRVRVFGDVRARPFRSGDRASAVQGRRGGHAAARPADARLSDDGGTWAGDAAQGRRAHARAIRR